MHISWLCQFRHNLHHRRKQSLQVSFRHVTHMGDPERLSLDFSIAVIKGKPLIGQPLFQTGQIDVTGITGTGKGL